MLIQDFLIQAAQRYPDKVLISHAGQKRTYGETFSAALSFASWLSSEKFPSGFRVAILTDDPFEYITAYFAALLAGGIAVGLNTQPTTRSLKHIINDCTPAVLVINSKFLKFLASIENELPSIQKVVLCKAAPDQCVTGPFSCAHFSEILAATPSYPPLPLGEGDMFSPRLTGDEGLPKRNLSPCESSNPDVQPTDLAQLIYTSGTTGEPKGVMLTHANLVANTRSIVEYLQLTQNDKVMAVLPFFYSYGNSVLLTHIAVGGSLVVNQSFLYPNVILDEMAAEQVTGFSGVPSTYAILLNRSAITDYSFPYLRYITQAGAAMSPELARRLQHVLPQVKIFIMYGQTEASARLSYLPPEDLYNKSGSIGKAIPGVTLTLWDKGANPVLPGETGEIVANGANIMAGYWQKPDESLKVLRPEGLWTGDLAYQDADGYFYIVSRKSEIIKSGSHRIGPKEIEEVLMEHEAVHEAAVIGEKDEILGEAIMGCIVLEDGMTCSEKEIIKHCRKNLPAYKLPHRIRFLAELPKTTTGKIRRAELREGVVHAK